MNRATIAMEGGRGGETPAVTVAISLYNYERFVTSCLESVMVQTLTDIDLIVVDDCSKDDGATVVKDWLATHGDRFNNYRLIVHTRNMGLSAARNTGFEYARSKYVFVLDADNLIYARCLASLASALDNCDASFGYSYQEKFGDVSCLQNVTPWNANSLQKGNTVDAMVLMQRNAWERAGGYSENETMRLGWEDFEMWFKIARIGGWGILVREILGRYRVHGQSMLRTTTNPNAPRLWAYLRTTYPEFFTNEFQRSAP